MLGSISLTSVATAQTPSPQWINFYSSSTTLNGQQVPTGSLIEAHGPTGVCGSFVVHTPGAYGFLPCYLDAPNTPAIEGIRPGDTVSFTIDGYPAGTFGVPSSIQNGDRFQVDLSAQPDGTTRSRTCMDSDEPDNSPSQATDIGGVESHTFSIGPRGGVDQDWSRIAAVSGWVYQITAYGDPNSVTDPLIRLYDASGTLLAENNNYLWGTGAEIWWWNNGPDQAVYAEVVEVNGNSGCFHYTLTLVPWSPGTFQETFGPK